MKKTSAYIALSLFIALGCSKAPLKVSGAKAAASAETSIQPGGGSYSSGVTADCPSLPQAILAPESAPPYVAGTQVTWKITAQGCYGSFSPADQPEITFQDTLTFKKTYDNAGTFSEKRSIIVRDGQGNALGLFETAATSITIVSASAPPAAPPPPAPTCTIARTAPFLAAGQTIPVVMNLQGQATSATLNSVLVANGETVALPALADGRYVANGVVTGPGGSTLCSMVFTPPTCSMAAETVLFPYADLTLSHNVAADLVSSVTIDGVALTENLDENPIPFRRARVAAEGSAQRANAIVTTDFGDKARCVFGYAPGTPQVVNVVVSFMADADVNVYLDVNHIQLSTGGWNPAADLQILAVLEDGTESIEYNLRQPFLNGNDNQTFAQNGEFSRYLIGPAKPFSLRTTTFASLNLIPGTSSPIAGGSNRNGVHNLQSVVGHHLSYLANDTDWYAAYYQVAVCKSGFACRYW